MRVATGRDAMGVAQAHVRSWQAGYEGLVAQSYLDALRPEDRAQRYGFDQMNPEGPFTQVAVDGDTICGHVTTGVSRDPDRQGAGEIWAIYVDPNKWRNGIGRLLMLAGCEQLRSQGLDTACLWVLSGNVRARRFYEATGWQWDGAERTDTIGDGVVHEVRYERTLPAAYTLDDGAGLSYRGASLVEDTAENDTAGDDFVAAFDGDAAEVSRDVRRLR
ncbi:MAG: N-acetyltransferase family protein [Mycobacterium sp.]